MTKISQLSSIGDSLAVDDQFLIRDVSDGSAPNKSVTVSGITRALDVGTAAAPAIAFATDKNTGIYSPGADQVAISTNGTGRLFVNSSGSVGIGTSSPGQSLHVNGSGTQYIQISSTTNDATTLLGATSSGSFLINQSTTLPTQIWTNGSPRIHVSSAGLVGIGTASPSVKLEVSGSAGSNPEIRCVDGTINSQWYQDSNGYSIFGTFSNHPQVFRTNGTERVRIDTSGRLLVGTSTAQGVSKLQVQGTTTDSTEWGGLFLRRGLANAAISSGFYLGQIDFGNQDGGVAAFIRAEGDAQWGTNDYPGRLVFSTCPDGSATPVERLRIKSTGEVSITGANVTTEPDALFTVYRAYGAFPGKSSNYYGITSRITGFQGNYSDCAAIFGTSEIDLTPAITGKGGTTSATGYGVQGWVSSNTDGYGTSYALYGRAQQTGSTNGSLIGVGIELPDYNGGATDGIRYMSAFTGAGTQTVLRIIRNSSTIGSITTSTTATAYNTSSDYRLKENVVPLVNAIPRLLQVPVHRFNFIASPDTTVDGFIAHEVAQYVPEAVTGQKDEMQTVPVLDEQGNPRVDEDGNAITEQKPLYQGIDQSKLVPLLTAALQEAIGEIESLKARVAALEAA